MSGGAIGGRGRCWVYIKRFRNKKRIKMGVKSKWRVYDREIGRRIGKGDSLRRISRDLSKLEDCNPSGLYAYISRNKKRLKDVAKRIESGDYEDPVVEAEEVVIVKEVIREVTIEERLEMDRKYRVMGRELKNARNKYRRLIDDHEKLREAYDDMLYVSDHMRERDGEVFNIKVKKKNGKGRIVLQQFSDWHCDEIVTKGQTNGRNEYNPDIFKKRVGVLTDGVIKILRHTNKECEAHTLVIHLGGDWISGWIHDEGKESNSMSPIEGIGLAGHHLNKCIDTVIENMPKSIKKVVLVCSRGNHGRVTRRMRFSNEFETNYETMIYSELGRKFDGENRVDVVHTKSPITYVNVGGQVIRFIHGQQIRYKDGVGGITIPLNKRQKNWDRSEVADFNSMGHFHQCSMPNSRTIMNGSLVGFNAYADNFGFSYEDPMQGMISYYDEYKTWHGFYKVNCGI